MNDSTNLTGNKIGEWKLSAEQPCLVIGTGAVAIKDKQQTGDFSLDYDWLMEQIAQYPKRKEYEMSKMSPVTLAIALKEKFEKIGQMNKLTRPVSIINETKRCYRKSPKTGEELLGKQYSSEPWDISMMSRLT